MAKTIHAQAAKTETAKTPRVYKLAKVAQALADTKPADQAAAARYHARSAVAGAVGKRDGFAALRGIGRLWWLAVRRCHQCGWQKTASQGRRTAAPRAVHRRAA